ncbi:CLUMA_CG005179, isoform A [Clunio marinus]|uniref:CLUMA_CG005179, isoform A n=1 Tax=Clunio marinus TaxID=568069 RepID=A0A1J1HYA4_9DIPT|nr:CLUMA_CG005179, isoform A [Clunio marinus]
MIHLNMTATQLSKYKFKNRISHIVSQVAREILKKNLRKIIKKQNSKNAMNIKRAAGTNS